MNQKDLLKLLPPVDQILGKSEVENMIKMYTRPVVIRTIRGILGNMRAEILKGNITAPAFGKDPAKTSVNVKISKKDLTVPTLEKTLVKTLAETLKERDLVHLREVINGTGVIIHTNLGRSPMARYAVADISRLAGKYINLEYDLKTGYRGSRHDIAKDLIRDITGAEDCLVVNNNAAAVLLVLSAIATGREVIVSRGELVEIGGSFRVPEVMAQGGAKLVEVGTTNKTYIHDYEGAINDNTALLLKVHTSNYRICGFTEEVPRNNLVALGEKYNLPVAEDLGSGVLIDLKKYGIGNEPTVQESLKSGIDIVTFSGDKLLGGPQAGIIAGRGQLIKQIAKHPLARAIRVDRLVLSALQSTLRAYLEGEGVTEKIPVLKMLTTPLNVLKDRAGYLLELLTIIKPYAEVYIESDYSQVGGGSMPLEEIETFVVAISPRNISPDELDRRLRFVDTPVVGRIIKDRYLIDVRTVFDEQLPILAEMLTLALTGGIKP